VIWRFTLGTPGLLSSRLMPVFFFGISVSHCWRQSLFSFRRKKNLDFSFFPSRIIFRDWRFLARPIPRSSRFSDRASAAGHVFELRFFVSSSLPMKRRSLISLDDSPRFASAFLIFLQPPPPSYGISNLTMLTFFSTLRGRNYKFCFL